MTAIDAAVEAIKAAGWDQMAAEFRAKPEYRARIARVVSRDVSRRIGPKEGERLGRLLMAAAR